MPFWHVASVMQGPATPQARPSCTGWPAQAPFRQASLLVQPFWSSQALPSDAGTLPAQRPFSHVSTVVQALPSSQGVVVSGMPTHAPPSHVSRSVQMLPSSQGVLFATGVPVQVPP